MSEKYTPQEFLRYFGATYWDLGIEGYTREVLRSEPREGDTWQEEKFLLFQAVGKNIARMSEEYLTNILSTGRRLCQKRNIDPDS